MTDEGKDMGKNVPFQRLRTSTLYGVKYKPLIKKITQTKLQQTILCLQLV